MSCSEVERVIFSLINSSARWDDIPTFIAKKCLYSYLKPLTYLIIIYVNKICNTSNLLFSITYADDTSVLLIAY